MTIRSKATLPRRKDLDTIVLISPDEAGIFDLALVDTTQTNLRDELDLILDTGVSADNDVLEAEYSHPDGDDYYAEVIGVPEDTAEVSRWTIRFVVMP